MQQDKMKYRSIKQELNNLSRNRQIAESTAETNEVQKPIQTTSLVNINTAEGLHPGVAKQSPMSIHVAGGHEGLHSALVDLHLVTRL